MDCAADRRTAARRREERYRGAGTLLGAARFASPAAESLSAAAEAWTRSAHYSTAAPPTCASKVEAQV